jgi:hypothetical protein
MNGVNIGGRQRPGEIDAFDLADETGTDLFD